MKETSYFLEKYKELRAEIIDGIAIGFGKLADADNKVSSDEGFVYVNANGEGGAYDDAYIVDTIALDKHGELIFYLDSDRDVVFHCNDLDTLTLIDLYGFFFNEIIGERKALLADLGAYFIDNENETAVFSFPDGVSVEYGDGESSIKMIMRVKDAREPYRFVMITDDGRGEVFSVATSEIGTEMLRDIVNEIKEKLN